MTNEAKRRILSLEEQFVLQSQVLDYLFQKLEQTDDINQKLKVVMAINYCQESMCSLRRTELALSKGRRAKNILDVGLSDSPAA